MSNIFWAFAALIEKHGKAVGLFMVIVPIAWDVLPYGARAGQPPRTETLGGWCQIAGLVVLIGYRYASRWGRR